MGTTVQIFEVTFSVVKVATNKNAAAYQYRREPRKVLVQADCPQDVNRVLGEHIPLAEGESVEILSAKDFGKVLA